MLSLPDALATLADSLTFAEQYEERCELAETHRVIGVVRSVCGSTHQAEESFRRAIEVAREQKAKLFELRAATSLALLLRDQGRRREGRELLAPIHDWFTEGFDTPLLVKVRSLLVELRGQKR